MSLDETLTRRWLIADDKKVNSAQNLRLPLKWSLPAETRVWRWSRRTISKQTYDGKVKGVWGSGEDRITNETHKRSGL